MTDQAISALTAGTQPTGTEVGPFVQGGTTKKLTAKQLADLGPFRNVLADLADATGGSDTSTACQATITAVQNAGGGTVWFPTGTFNLGTTGVTVTTSGVTLQGANPYATFLQVTQNSSNPAIYLHGNSAARNSLRHQHVSDMTITMGPLNGSGAASSGTTPGIKIDYLTFPTLNNVNVFYFQTGVYAFQTNNLRTQWMFIAPVNTCTTTYGVYVDNAGNSTGTENFSPKISYVNVDGTSCTGTVYGFYVGNGGAFQDLEISHCEADTVTYGFYLDGTSASAEALGADAHLDNCFSDHAVNGFYITNGSSTINTQIDMRSCYFSSQAGTASVAALTVSGSVGVHARGLDVIVISGATLPTGVSFLSSSSLCTVVDGNFGGAGTMTAGIDASSNCSKIGISSCTFGSAVSTPIGSNITGGTAAGCKGRGNISTGTLADFG